MTMRNWLLIVSLMIPTGAHAKLVRYELTATRPEVNLSGRKSVDFAIALNGTIPAPTLEFTEGDDAEIVVRNRVPGEELSIHWHGLLLPSEMDGVPYVTTPPIRSGDEFTFKFKIRQHGTFWYHSHTALQEQKGVYGAFIIHPKKRTIAYDRDVVVVLSDWSDENADNILKNLKKDGDYYLYKKGTVRSWFGAIQAGALGTYISSEWTRMGGMDLSDVGYDAFLINGKRELSLSETKPGEKIRIRVINAGASTYFHVALGDSPMKVISADGIDIQPTLAKELLMGMAETYDVLFEPKDSRSYELRATAQDGTGWASGWIGSGEKVSAPKKPFPDLYAPMNHGGHEGHSSHNSHDNHSEHGNAHAHHAPTVDTLTVDQLMAPASTELPAGAKVHEVKLVLDGDMGRYVWHINNKAIHEDRTLVIQEGEVVRYTFENRTMMHHPMHLHGHFFRVLNGAGARSPLKHTVDVGPHSSRTIEFYTNEPGEWMLHCHNLFHMKTGMARVVKYSTFNPKPEMAHLQKHDPHLHDHYYFHGTAELSTNHAQASLQVSQTWTEWFGRIETRNTAGNNFSFSEPWEVEGDVFYRRWMDQNLHFMGGGTAFDRELSAVIGVGYRLPLLIETHLLVSHRGKFRLDAEKRFHWTGAVFTDAHFVWRPNQAQSLGHDLEYEISLMYGPSWSWAAGLMLTNENIGAGIQVQF